MGYDCEEKGTILSSHLMKLLGPTAEPAWSATGSPANARTPLYRPLTDTSVNIATSIVDVTPKTPGSWAGVRIVFNGAAVAVVAIAASSVIVAMSRG